QLALGIGDKDRALEMQQVRNNDIDALALTGGSSRQQMRLAGIEERLPIQHAEIKPARIAQARSRAIAQRREGRTAEGAGRQLSQLALRALLPELEIAADADQHGRRADELEEAEIELVGSVEVHAILRPGGKSQYSRADQQIAERCSWLLLVLARHWTSPSPRLTKEKLVMLENPKQKGKRTSSSAFFVQSSAPMRRFADSDARCPGRKR